MKNDSDASLIPPMVGLSGDDFSCARCGTADHLIIESMQAPEPDVDGWVLVDYSCGECQSFYAHEVSVNRMAAFVARLEAPLGVVEVGHQYVHCGEPMHEGDMNLTEIAEPGTQEEAILDVVLPTVVLRCRCGFQMSIPR